MYRHNNHVRSRRLMVENLESRAMLAGNVTVAVTDGVLKIQGDGASNDLQIRQLKQTFTGDWPGAKYQISGNYMGRSDTLINGQSDPVVVEGVKAGAVINLGNGNNALGISNPDDDVNVVGSHRVNIPGDVTITTVGGRDDLRLYLENGKSVTVTAGSAADYLQISGSTVNQLTVNTDPRPSFGYNPPSVRDRVQIQRLTANGDVTINGGNYKDEVQISGPSQFHGKFSVDLGNSPDTLAVNGGVSSPVVFHGAINIVADNANVSFSNAIVDEVFRADLFGTVSISTGAGHDDLTVSVGVNRRPHLNVSLGDGDDSLSLTENRVLNLTVDGGNGTDTLTRFGENAFEKSTITNVEEIVDF